MTYFLHLRSIALPTFQLSNTANLLLRKAAPKFAIVLYLLFVFSVNTYSSSNTYGSTPNSNQNNLAVSAITVILTTNIVDCYSGTSSITAQVYNDGIEVTGSGNYAYQWSYSSDGITFVPANQTSYTIVIQSAGIYSVTVTNMADGTSVSTNTTIAPNIAPNVLINIAQSDCGSYMLMPTTVGGVAPYTYTWSEPVMADMLVVTMAGTYTVIVTDGNGCTGSNSIVLSSDYFCPFFTFDLFNNSGPTVSGTTPILPGYNVVNYYIDYGDGNVFYTPQPISFIHDYTNPGAHTVCITATILTPLGQLCYCTQCQTITTTDPCSNLSALEIFQNGGLQIGINPPFSNTYNIAHYSFNFGDGSVTTESDEAISVVHTYPSDGTYTVCVTVTIQLPTEGTFITCTVCKEVIIGSCGLVPNYSFEEGAYPYPNAPNQINLTTHWFHPPSTSSSSDWYSNTFPGGYLLSGSTYNLMPHSGCKYGGFDLNSCEGLEVQLNQPINAGCTYNVDFWWTPRKTTTTNYEFWAVVGHNSCTTANSSGMCNHSCMGDMHVKVTATPANVPGTWYHYTGTYTNGVGGNLNYVVFTGQMSVAPVNNYIYIDDVCFSLAPAPCEIHAILDIPNICNTVGEQVDFCPNYTLGCTTQATSVHWDFGDGTTYDQSLPINCPGHIYNTAGTYNVCLTVIGNNGTETCSDTVCESISVNNLVYAIGYSIDACAGSSVILNNIFTTNVGLTYQWTKDGVFYGIFSTPALTVVATATASYEVNTFDANGCLMGTAQYYVVVQTPMATASSNSPVCAGNTISLASSGGLSYAWSGPGFTSALQNPNRNNATTAKAGVYTVTVTDAYGCTATASTVVAVSPLPTATITGASSFCSGTSITLTASGGGTYWWGNGNNTNTRNITTAGTYTVTVTNASGCTKTASKTISVLPAPTATATVNCGATVAAITVTATGAAPLSYSINGASFQAANVFSGLANGTYTITVRNTNGCTKTITVVINCCSNLTPPTALTTTINSPTSVTLAWSAVQAACQYQIEYSKRGAFGIWGAWTSLPAQTATTKTINGLQAGKTYKWRVKAICCLGAISTWSNEKTFTLPLMLLIEPNKNEISQAANANAANNNLNIYPNPSSNFVTIDYYAQTTHQITISLFDVTGKEAFTKTYIATENNNSITIDLTSLSKGYYLVELNDVDIRKYAKLLIVR